MSTYTVSPVFVVVAPARSAAFSTESSGAPLQLRDICENSLCSSTASKFTSINFIFLQLSEAEEPNDSSSFLERWAYYVRTMGEVESKPEGLAPYFSLLFDASNRSNIEKHKLSIYDDMVRDEIQIEAEKEYAIQEALEEKELEMRAAVDAAKSQGVIDTARNMKAVGITSDIICKCTGLTMEQIAGL